MRRLIALGTLVLGTSARAETALPVEREDVDLHYRAPDGCPDRAGLIGAVIRRAPAARFAPGAGRVFTVEVDARGDHYVGTLAVEDGGARAADRTLTAPRCDDLVGALALVVALAIDPQAIFAPEAPPVDAPPVTPAPRPRWGFGAEVRGHVAGGVTPGALLGGGVELRLVRRGLGHVGLGALAGRDREDTAGGVARFTWIAGRATACWQAYARRIEADTCAHLEAGGLDAEGAGIVGAQGATRLWLAAGAHGSTRWPARSRAFAELQLGITVPLVYHHFYFNPDVTVHRTPALIPWLGVGAGLRFP